MLVQELVEGTKVSHEFKHPLLVQALSRSLIWYRESC